MTKKQKEEKGIFDFFEKLHPNFAGRTVKCVLGNDPPDILCEDAKGKRIGVELGEWLNQGQMEIEKEAETSEKTFRNALGSEKTAHPRNFGHVWIGRKEKVRLRPQDAAQFRTEMYALMEEIDEGWARNEDVNGPQGLMRSDFSKYPVIARYVQNLKFFPTNIMDTPAGIAWIDFPARGGAYSSQSAVEALKILIEKKTKKYERLHAEEKLDELYLVAYYDQGLFYNSPYHTLGFGFDEIANICRQWVKKNPGKFQKIFLLDATGDGKVAEIL